MKYKAKVTFAGYISMVAGEVKEIEDEYIIKDLLQAKYIEPAEDKPKKTTKKK